MNNITIIKVVSICVCGLALFVVSNDIILESQHTEKLKHWNPDSTLEYTDFLRTPPFFEFETGATILSFMRLRKFKDGTYKGFTIIDRTKSWFDKQDYSEYLLRHERYHAILTASGTQRLNNRIKNDSITYEEAKDLLFEFSEKTNNLQDKYDFESDHSRDEAMQHYWEYKIDSMYYMFENIQDTDLFSGISCYFPAPPSIHVEKDTFYLSKEFYLEAYGMGFKFITKYDASTDTTNSKNGYLDQLKSLGYINYSVKTGDWENMYSIDIQYTDTVTNKRFHERILVDGNHMYQLTVYHSSEASEDAMYKRMKEQFLNSFSKQSFASHWIKELNKKGSKKLFDVTPVSKVITGDYYTSLSYSDNSLIYHEPFIHGDKLIIVFKSERHPTEDIDQVRIRVNDKVFVQEPDSSYQFISLDLDLINKKYNRLQLGYLTKSDSVRDARHLYSTVINNFSISNTMKN